MKPGTNRIRINRLPGNSLDDADNLDTRERCLFPPTQARFRFRPPLLFIARLSDAYQLKTLGSVSKGSDPRITKLHRCPITYH